MAKKDINTTMQSKSSKFELWFDDRYDGPTSDSVIYGFKLWEARDDSRDDLPFIGILCDELDDASTYKYQITELNYECGCIHSWSLDYCYLRYDLKDKVVFFSKVNGYQVNEFISKEDYLKLSGLTEDELDDLIDQMLHNSEDTIESDIKEYFTEHENTITTEEEPEVKYSERFPDDDWDR